MAWKIIVIIFLILLVEWVWALVHQGHCFLVRCGCESGLRNIIFTYKAKFAYSFEFDTSLDPNNGGNLVL